LLLLIEFRVVGVHGASEREGNLPAPHARSEKIVFKYPRQSMIDPDTVA
jgi:hypothetical protein